ncbi:MAG: DNA gyrase inhibitor YacG [Alphaproteobacteria bacterium]
MAEITKLEPKRKGAKCPVCGKPSAQHYRPFCSKHCADIDLGRWLDGAYRIATDDPPEDASLADDGAEEK